MVGSNEQPLWAAALVPTNSVMTTMATEIFCKTLINICSTKEEIRSARKQEKKVETKLTHIAEYLQTGNHNR